MGRLHRRSAVSHSRPSYRVPALVIAEVCWMGALSPAEKGAESQPWPAAKLCLRAAPYTAACWMEVLSPASRTVLETSQKPLANSPAQLYILSTQGSP